MRGIVSEQLEEFLTQVNIQIAQAARDNIIFTPDMVRGNLNKLAAFTSKSPDIDYAQDKNIKVDEQRIPVRVYSPDPTKTLPVVVYFHGGGHMCGSIELYDPMCRKIAHAGQCVVISVEYRLSPEHPYPTGVDDCQQAVIHYQQVLTDLNYNDNIFIAGDSAGGAIATTLAMRSLTNKDIKIDKQILIYPNVDYTGDSPSIQENGTGFLLEQSKIKWYFEHYFANNEDQVAVSPLFGPITADLPSTLIITAGCDPLRDEGEAYAQALNDAGVFVKHHQFEHMIHAFMNLEDLVPDECKHLYQLIGNFIQDN